MTSTTLPLVHLVGSVPLSTTEDVFKRIPVELPGLVKHVPDGETGERGIFIVWQYENFPSEIRDSPYIPSESKPDPNFALKQEHIKPTGYDKAALASYQTFRKLREQGEIPSNVRFQVCLPTPMNPISCFIAHDHAITAEKLYETRLLEALAVIQETIPSSDLAIQWDMAVEPAHMEHAYGPKRDEFTILKPYYSPVKEGIAARVARLAAAVKKDVPMGFHLCYGDFGHVHYVQPQNLGLLVDLANAMHDAVSVHRTIEWMHMPVPKDRTDDQFFTPLDRLAPSDDTTLFLGLVHAHDEEGTKKRIDAANRALAGKRHFGVGTECGLGRTPVPDLDSIFSIARNVTKRS